MKFWSVSTPPTSSVSLGLSVLSFIILAAMPLTPSMAEDAAKPAAPTAVKPDSQPAATKSAPSSKPENPASKSAQSSKPKAKQPGALVSAECERTGKRVVAALARDDSGAASQFYTFYTAFKCSPQALASAFGCIVNLQKDKPDVYNPKPEEINQCWEQPSVIPKDLPENPANKDGAH